MNSERMREMSKALKSNTTLTIVKLNRNQKYTKKNFQQEQ